MTLVCGPAHIETHRNAFLLHSNAYTGTKVDLNELQEHGLLCEFSFGGARSGLPQ